MMALQILLILEVIVILFSPSSAYPVYGTKRYGRSTVHRVTSPSWAPYQMVRTQRYPVNYYELYPYSQTYPDDYYYPQESYPVYYPPARTSKYEVYQAVLPYYYQDRPRSSYYNYDNDPVVDLQEEMMQEDEREDTHPVGHELMYENEEDADDSLDDVNAAFLQNLIMSQMYKDGVDPKDFYQDYHSGSDVNYGKWVDSPTPNQQSSFYKEDEDVRELKQLANPKSKISSNNPDDMYWYQRNEKHRQNNNNNYNDKRSQNDNTKLRIFTERKPVIKSISTTTIAPSSPSNQPKRDVRGQKEEVLMRPATPVRHPFSGPVLEMMTKNDPERKRTPSVYDTIKHMLDMEKSLENKYGADEIIPHMKKRIISSEESLTHQLSVLKKSK